MISDILHFSGNRALALGDDSQI
jgi:hypothetical protein